MKKNICSKKVLLVARDYPPLKGGISEYISSVYSLFPANELVVIAYYQPGYEKYDRRSPWKIIRTGRISTCLSKGKLAILPLSITSIFYLLRNRKSIRAIHAEQVQSSVAAYICCKLFHLPMCVFAYGMEVTTADRFGFKRRMYHVAEKVFTISSYTKRLLLRRGVDEKKIRLFTPGVSMESFRIARKLTLTEARHKLGIPQDRTVLLSVARLVVGAQYKGIDTIILSLPRVLEHFPNLQYFIIGNGNDRERLMNIASELGVDRVVQFVGSVSDEEKGLYYAACNIFVMPNRIVYSRRGENTEGFGIVFIEANLFGKPVIGGIGGAEDAVEHGISGLTTKPDSVEAVAESIRYLLANPDIAKRLGEQGRQRALSKFVAEKIASAFYKECDLGV